MNAHETVTKRSANDPGSLSKTGPAFSQRGIADISDGTPSKVKIETVEAMMRTNFVRSLAVTQAMLPLLQQRGKTQVNNVSSELASVNLHNDLSWKFAPVKYLAYCASKAALNMFTVQLAYEFRDGDIAVNSVNPGYTATDLNQNSGTQTIEEGWVKMARLAPLDPPVSGKFLETGGEIPWYGRRGEPKLAIR